MSDGRIVYEPPRQHGCGPLPTFAHDGAVWQCGDCGKTWVCMGRVNRRYGDLTDHWREEGKRERRRRERRAREAAESQETP